MALTARPATLSDAPFLLRLRNDAQTVAMSRVQSPVTAHEHVAWLERTLADPTRALMIVTGPSYEPCEHRGECGWSGCTQESIATYRLDGLGSPSVEVSLTVAPECRGQDLARQIIELAARHAVRLGADVVTAEIRRENIPSFVAFFRNGFLIIGWSDDVVTTVEADGRLRHSGGLLRLEVPAEDVIHRACPLCLARVPHHTNATASIGGPEGRHPRYDLHVGEGGGLQECEAGDLWLAWEGARARNGRAAGSSPAASTSAAPPASAFASSGCSLCGSGISHPHFTTTCRSLDPGHWGCGR